MADRTPRLTSLNLGRNDEGLSELSSQLPHVPLLASLKIDSNLFVDAGIHACAAHVRRSSRLRELEEMNIGTSPSKESMTALRNALVQCDVAQRQKD